jgi:hypothetical protein
MSVPGITVDTANRLHGGELNVVIVLHPLSGCRTHGSAGPGSQPGRDGPSVRAPREGAMNMKAEGLSGASLRLTPDGDGAATAWPQSMLHVPSGQSPRLIPQRSLSPGLACSPTSMLPLYETWRFSKRKIINHVRIAPTTAVSVPDMARVGAGLLSLARQPGLVRLDQDHPLSNDHSCRGGSDRRSSE